jgi:hypothetical protein
MDTRVVPATPRAGTEDRFPRRLQVRTATISTAQNYKRAKAFQSVPARVVHLVERACARSWHRDGGSCVFPAMAARIAEDPDDRQGDTAAGAGKVGTRLRRSRYRRRAACDTAGTSTRTPHG